MTTNNCTTNHPCRWLPRLCDPPPPLRDACFFLFFFCYLFYSIDHRQHTMTIQSASVLWTLSVFRGIFSRFLSPKLISGSEAVRRTGVDCVLRFYLFFLLSLLILLFYFSYMNSISDSILFFFVYLTFVLLIFLSIVTCKRAVQRQFIEKVIESCIYYLCLMMCALFNLYSPSTYTHHTHLFPSLISDDVTFKTLTLCSFSITCVGRLIFIHQSWYSSLI